MSDELQIEEVKSEIDDERTPSAEFTIATYPTDFTLEILAQKLAKGDIEIPPFQRGFVWSKAQASLLIESFMMGLPVPQIFLYTDEDQRLLVVDGQQRLKSIQYFLEGRWRASADGRRGPFKLEGIAPNSRWYEKSFSEFTEPDRRKLNNSVLRAIVVRQLDPDDDTSVYHIFERLNTTGTPLAGQEIRNAAYHGRLNDLLNNRLNTNADWRRLIGMRNPDNRLKDAQLILRYMALYHWADKYFAPMKDFLSSFMRKHRNPDDNFLEEETRRFNHTCAYILECLGPKPFHPRGPLNSSIFDAVFVTFAKHAPPFPEDIRKRFEDLLRNPEFDDQTHFGTTSELAVKTRLRLTERFLFG
jgi:uncharacterized protein DUF262